MRYKLITLSTLLAAFMLAASGCTTAFERHYVPHNLHENYPTVQNVKVVRVGTQDIEAVRERLYPDAVMLGSSEFAGRNEPESDLKRFARSIGADTVLWSQQWLGATVGTRYHTIPRTESATVTTQQNGTTTTTHITRRSQDYVPYTDTQMFYEHQVVFLRSGE